MLARNKAEEFGEAVRAPIKVIIYKDNSNTTPIKAKILLVFFILNNPFLTNINASINTSIISGK